MYEYLKKLFGAKEDGTPEALTLEELSKKISESKELKLVNLSEGGYVSKEKFDAKETELNGVKTQLADANKEIQSYKDMDIEKIKQAAADWEKKYNDDTAALNKQIADNERAYNEDLFLRNYKFTSKAAESGIREMFRTKGFPFEKGKFLGATEYMDSLMADEDFKGAFVKEEPKPEAEPQKPEQKPKFADPKPQTPPPKQKLSLMELMKRKNENPNAEITFD